MNEMIDYQRVRVLLNESIQRAKTREYAHNDAMFKSLRAIFDAKLNKELGLTRRKIIQPLLDTVLTEQEIDDTKEPS